MTVDEKREAIENECCKYLCKDCPLYEYTNGVACHSVNFTSDKRIEDNYKYLFGIDEPTAEATAQLETIAEDCDTIIKIKSSRKIDSISIYFKEDEK